MLAVTSVIVEKYVSICFLAFYNLQAAPPKRRGARGNFPYSPCRRALVR